MRRFVCIEQSPVFVSCLFCGSTCLTSSGGVGFLNPCTASVSRDVTIDSDKLKRLASLLPQCP